MFADRRPIGLAIYVCYADLNMHDPPQKAKPFNINAALLPIAAYLPLSNKNARHTVDIIAPSYFVFAVTERSKVREQAGHQRPCHSE
jgi:hypothetical protein